MTSQADQDRLITQIRAFGYSAKRTDDNPNVVNVWSKDVPVGMVTAWFNWGHVVVTADFGDGCREQFVREDLGKAMRIAALVSRLRGSSGA